MSRLALVTGGTRGIGAAISKLLKAEGYRVAANYCSNDEAAEAFYRDTDIPVFKFDVSDHDACRQGIQAVEAQLGPVDILVANAGVTRDSAFHRMNYDQWSQVIRINLDSMFNCTRPVIEGMRERGFGRIVLISSINGQKGQARGIFSGLEFLSTQRIQSEWIVWKDLLESGDFNDAEAQPSPGVLKAWWTPSWIPFTYNGAGDHLCIDMHPSSQGCKGQIIAVWHDDGKRSIKADSFAKWFTAFIQSTY